MYFDIYILSLNLKQKYKCNPQYHISTYCFKDLLLYNIINILLRINMDELQREACMLLRKSDALSFFKKISASMTKEQFVDFSMNTMVMKSAYDKNRVKAVEYMLSFFPPNKPELLLIIHLQRMIVDDQIKHGYNMLKVLIKNFSTDVCYKHIDVFLNAHAGRNRIIYEKSTNNILTFILENKLPISQPSTSTKHKI